MEFFHGTPPMIATSPCDLIFLQFLHVLFGRCFLDINGVEIHPFEVSSCLPGACFKGPRNGDNEEAQKP